MRKILILMVLALGLGWSATAFAQSGTSSTQPAASAADPAKTAGAGEAAMKEKVDQLMDSFSGLQSAFNDMVASTQAMAHKIGSGQSPVVLTTNQIIGIALGATGGALVVDFLGGGGLATIGGAVLGGAAAHWLMSPVDVPAPGSDALPSKSG